MSSSQQTRCPTKPWRRPQYAVQEEEHPEEYAKEYKSEEEYAEEYESEEEDDAGN